MTGRWGPGPAMPWQLYAKKRAERQEQEQKPRVTGSGRVYLPPGNKRLNHPHTPGRPITSIAHLLHIHELSDLEPRPGVCLLIPRSGPALSVLGASCCSGSPAKQSVVDEGPRRGRGSRTLSTGCRGARDGIFSRGPRASQRRLGMGSRAAEDICVGSDLHSGHGALGLHRRANFTRAGEGGEGVAASIFLGTAR
ncbi:hypothetical protein CYMTET_49007 [Cymbomonas tetramitiformis]|uniref:Uncharacterized protein n=1 Tax=Cymbomonas tetramitiformis TaxID=36881 RepID=A0AAE0BR21_9CHLO|nr:hypothetical protein CYMTET_49007 [Cymbomonas tetramitiformis]